MLAIRQAPFSNWILFTVFAVRFSACLKLLREGACFNEDGSRFHANGPLYLKVVLPISKLNLGDIKELVFRKLYAVS